MAHAGPCVLGHLAQGSLPGFWPWSPKTSSGSCGGTAWSLWAANLWGRWWGQRVQRSKARAQPGGRAGGIVESLLKGSCLKVSETLGRSRGSRILRPESEAPYVPQVFLWEQQRLAGRLPRGGTGDSVLLSLAQGSHRPLSRAQSSPAAPASLPTPEPASQARVLPSSETSARTLPFTTGEAWIRVGAGKGAGGTQAQPRVCVCVMVLLRMFLEAIERFLHLVRSTWRCPMKQVERVIGLILQIRRPGLPRSEVTSLSNSRLTVRPG